MERTLCRIATALVTVVLIILTYQHKATLRDLEQEKQRFQAYKVYHQVFVQASAEEDRERRAENERLRKLLAEYRSDSHSTPAGMTVTGRLIGIRSVKAPTEVQTFETAQPEQQVIKAGGNE
jgi:ribosomal protein L18